MKGRYLKVFPTWMLLMTLFLVFAVSGAAAAAPAGEVNISSLVQIARAVREGGASLNDTRKWDLNGSGRVDIADLAQFARILNAQDVSPSPQIEAVRKEALEVTNTVRQCAGVAPVSPDAVLTRAAQVRAEEMAKSGVLSHERPDGSSCFTAYGYSSQRAENIAWIKNVPEADLGYLSVMQWYDSPSHRSAMEDSMYTAVGFGFSRSADGRWFGCQLFTDGQEIAWVDIPRT